MNNITGALYRVIKIKWGVSTNPWGSFLLSPFPLKPGGCCAKVGGINPGVWKTPWVCLMFHSTHNKPLLLFSSIFRGMVKTATQWPKRRQEFLSQMIKLLLDAFFLKVH